MSSFHSQPQRPTASPARAAPRPPIRWWLVGPLGAAMLAVLIRWLSSGGLRHMATDRHGHRDPDAALESLKQAFLLTAADIARLDLVRTLRDLGLGLDDVREVLGGRKSVAGILTGRPPFTPRVAGFRWLIRRCAPTHKSPPPWPGPLPGPMGAAGAMGAEGGSASEPKGM